MPGHAKVVDRRARTIRLSTVAVIWLGGLVAGFFALLSAAARYGCGSNETGLACRTSGSVIGLLVVVAVITVVTSVTVLTYERAARRVIVVGGSGLAALVVCFVAARSLLATV